MNALGRAGSDVVVGFIDGRQRDVADRVSEQVLLVRISVVSLGQRGRRAGAGDAVSVAQLRKCACADDAVSQRAGNGVVALGRAEGAEGTTRSRSRSAWRRVPVRAKLKRSVGADGTTWPRSQSAGNERGQTLLSRSYSLGSGLGWSGRERTAGDGGEGGWERRDGIGLAQTRQRGAGCEVDCVRCRLLEVIAFGQCGVFSRASLILQLSRLGFLLVSSHCQALCGVLSRWQPHCP